MEILGYRTVSDVDGIPYQVADVLHPGAILPVSIRTSDIHPVDEAQAIERVIDSSLSFVRIPNDFNHARYEIEEGTESSPIISGGEVLYITNPMGHDDIPF